MRSIHLGGESNKGEKCLCQEGSTVTAALKHGALDRSPVQMLLDHCFSILLPIKLRTILMQFLF